SVPTPDLGSLPWSTARLFQQDIPKAEEDSDEETTEVKKRWRPRQDVPKRQWILQEQVEFLEHMMLKSQRKAIPKDQISSQYSGIPEHNPSNFVLFEVSKTDGQVVQVTTVQPPESTISFSQPKGHKTLSMSEAELVIQDQRGKMTRYMMHGKSRMLHNPSAKPNESRKRLFGKLSKINKADGDDEEEDDIMGDIAFRNRKGAGRTRKELLDSVGDAGIKVDSDGVLGGTNDGDFGRGQRFGRFKASEQKPNSNDNNAQTGGESTKGNDGQAMADDFYKRDVQAEYEELDYDVNEQFDDDDVDVGETEVAVEGRGYADEEDEDDFDDDGMEGERIGGAEGLASLAGFKLMLAKARGEVTPDQIAESEEKRKKEEEDKKLRAADANKKQKANSNEPVDHLTKIIAAAQDARVRAEREQEERAKETTAVPVPVSKDLVNRLDENGQRVITIESVRREIWLNHGTIKLKRLMKLFDIGKKSSKERRASFQGMVKELCTLETDPTGGRMLVLKQHYANMG
ncbi:MAG: hypothetical protein SGBAC_006916, partial [Bacillariaceae sp.]